ncbi:tetratricopeptide repeat protein [Prosthecobacter dejongeii]|uniref:TolA-binding protein n=1 Tax=Prosthecobacter dejongeii TaxID=48465 RepID=A0A7W8DRZ4_9BACT|nr:tetratricopeptide repeat protein [Prosthecobacter dejongeii]MBB5039932.1 TolA-binding protein [Prosthecobacter dejongeii]
MSKATPPASPAPALDTLVPSSPMEQFLEANFKKLVLLSAAIALAAVVYGIISYTNKANAVAAGEAFAAAKTVEDCDLVISNHPGTTAAGNALVLKADFLWIQDKKDASVAALREFTTKHSDHPLLPEVILALATKLEVMGKADEAKPLFERVVSEFASSDAAALAQLRLGDLLWAAGKEEEAKAAYEAVPAKFITADPAFLDQSEGRLKWIAAKLPTKEVDGPPKPKVEAPAPGAPQLKLDSTSLNPTLMPAGAAPQIQVSPVAPSAPQIQVTPSAAPAPVMPAAPKIEVPAVPAAPAVPATPAPEAPKIEVKPAPAVPAPAPAPTPAPVPAPAQPETPAPAVPAKAS